MPYCRTNYFLPIHFRSDLLGLSLTASRLTTSSDSPPLSGTLHKRDEQFAHGLVEALTFDSVVANECGDLMWAP